VVARRSWRLSIPGITNAATEASNRLIKDAARIAFGFRNLGSQRRRVRLPCKSKRSAVKREG